VTQPSFGRKTKLVNDCIASPVYLVLAKSALRI
jgi:hypothetical protein